MFSTRPLIGVAFSLLLSVCLPNVAPSALAIEPPAAPTSDFLTDGGNTHEKERKEVEGILHTIEEQWNSHNLDGVMGFYADDYINNDGLDKKSVSALTQDFWKTYPDAKSTSETKNIRIEGPFATVESRDMAAGTTAKEMPGIGTKGDLQSVSEGQLYMKRIGTDWKIVGDRIDYEKVKVAFGLAKQLNTSFSAPEQVKAGHQYSARLELALPPGLTAVGSITSQPLQYPQPQPTDAWRPLDGSTLERVMPANIKNRNELLMATIGVTNSTRNSLMGIAFITRRLNVVPVMEEIPETTTAAVKAEVKDATAAKSEPKDHQ
jgi:hypothetical protein